MYVLCLFCVLFVLRKMSEVSETSACDANQQSKERSTSQENSDINSFRKLSVHMRNIRLRNASVENAPTLTLFQQCVTRTIVIDCSRILFVRPINKVYALLTVNNFSVVTFIVKFLSLIKVFLRDKHNFMLAQTTAPTYSAHKLNAKHLYILVSYPNANTTLT